MNATVGGSIGGIQSGDAVTKIELVWKSGAETEAQAQSAGRAVTLTAGGDITAFQSGTYALSSSYLVNGQTYTPAVRVTESRDGVDGFVGGWTSFAAFTAQTTITANFAGAGIDSGFTAITSGSGTATVGSGLVTLTTTVATDNALVRCDTALLSSKVFTATVKGYKGTTGYESQYLTPMVIVDSAAAPTASSPGTPLISLYFVSPASPDHVAYIQTAGATQYCFDGSGWVPSWTPIVGISNQNDNSYIIESNNTQFRLVIKNSSGTVLMTSPYLAWSSLNTPANSLWLISGDTSASNYGTLKIDQMQVVQ